MYEDTHRELMRTTTRLCEAEINPHFQDWESNGAFPAHDLFKQLGAAGLLGVNKPEAFGGSGLDSTYQVAFHEALGASRCASISLAVAVQTDMATPALARYGSDALRQEFLRPSITGEYVACLGVSEVEAGSDMSAIRTTARRDGDDYLIDGGKMWTTNGTQADWMCLLCNTDSGNPLFNKSLICVPMSSPGVTVVRRLRKLGMAASDTAQIFFDNVRVPARFVIGSPGRGLTYQSEAFLDERLCAAAASLLPMERAIALTIDYTRERRAFGRRVLDNQSVHFRLAELQTGVELLRSLVYRAAQQRAERDATRLVCMAKLTAGRLQREVMDSCLQYFGGMGYLEESEIARMFRDARLASIGGGTDEMMLLMISRLMGMLASAKE